jgi:outer membrane protein assembly factor BamB
LQIIKKKSKPMKKNNNMYIFSNGRVAAINKKDGSIIWEIKLKQYINTSMAYTVAQISVEDDKIFVGVSGIVICLATKDGALIWKNELKGWGYSYVSMANAGNTDQNQSTSASAAAAAAAVIAATA